MRVVERRHHLLRPRRRPRPGRPRARRRRGRRGAARRAHASRGRCGPRRRRRCRSSAAPKRSRPSARRSCCASSTSAARGQGGEIAQFTASYARGPPRGRGRQLRRACSAATTAPGSGSAPRRSPAAATRSRPGPRRSAPTAASSCSKTTRRQIAEQAARKALTLLDAGPAPSGSMPVVVGGGFGGVLFHEMTGHGLEADHIQKGASVYVGKLGEQVAQPLLNAYDDGRLPGEWGSDAIDDEGTPTQKTQVIEDGRLTSYLYDRLTAERDGVASTGNGRRESFRHLPIPRMTNTYIAPGDATPEAMIAERRAGLLRGLLRRRPGRPGDRRLRLRRLRGLPDRGRQGDPPLPRRDPDRQLPRGAGGDRRGRRRLLHEDRDLRQGRPESAGRHRPGPRPGAGDDGRRDRACERAERAPPGARSRRRWRPAPARPRPTPRATAAARSASTAARSRA